MRRQHAVQPAWGSALANAMERSRHLKTQTALARKSGVAQSTIGRILRDEVNPQSETLHRLAKALGIPLTVLTNLAEDAQTQAGSVIVHAAALSAGEAIEHALRQALTSWEDRKRGEQALEPLRQKESDAIDQLQELVRAADACGSLKGSTL